MKFYIELLFKFFAGKPDDNKPGSGKPENKPGSDKPDKPSTGKPSGQTEDKPDESDGKDFKIERRV